MMGERPWPPLSYRRQIAVNSAELQPFFAQLQPRPQFFPSPIAHSEHCADLGRPSSAPPHGASRSAPRHIRPRRRHSSRPGQGRPAKAISAPMRCGHPKRGRARKEPKAAPRPARRTLAAWPPIHTRFSPVPIESGRSVSNNAPKTGLARDRLRSLRKSDPTTPIDERRRVRTRICPEGRERLCGECKPDMLPTMKHAPVGRTHAHRVVEVLTVGGGDDQPSRRIEKPADEFEGRRNLVVENVFDHLIDNMASDDSRASGPMAPRNPAFPLIDPISLAAASPSSRKRPQGSRSPPKPRQNPRHRLQNRDAARPASNAT